MQKVITAQWQQAKISIFANHKQCRSGLNYLFYLLFFCMLAGSINHLQAALGVTTANSIIGTPPYLILSDGTKLRTFNELVGFNMPDGQGTMVKIDADKANNTLTIPTDTKFADILMLVTADGAAHTIPSTAQRDDDNDSGTPTGSMTGTWYIGADTVDDLDQKLPTCGGPYQLIIEADSVKTNTLYGNPNSFDYGSGSATYRFEPALKSQCEASAIMTITLNDTVQSKIADGVSSFSYTVKLLDENYNPFVGSTLASIVLLPADAQVVLNPLTTTTDSQGQQ